MKTGLKSSTQQVVLNNIEDHHTCGKNMPLIQCTGGVLPKLGEVRSYAKICQQRDGTWTKTLKTFPHPCPLLSNPWIFFISWQSWLQSSHSFQFWKNATRAMMSGNQPGDNLEDSDPEFAMFRLDIPQIIRNILKTGQLHCSMVSKTMDPSWTSNSCEMQVAWSCNKLHLECNSHNAIHNKMLKVIFCN